MVKKYCEMLISNVSPVVGSALAIIILWLLVLVISR